MYNPRKAHIFPHNDCEIHYETVIQNSFQRHGDGNSMPRAIRRSIVCREFTAITKLTKSQFPFIITVHRQSETVSVI